VRKLSGYLRIVPIWLVAAVMVAAAGAVCLAQTTAPAAGAGQPGADRMSFLELLLRGRWFMIPIALCSLLGMAVIIERLFALRRGAVIPSNFLPGLKATFRHGSEDRDTGLQYCRARDCPISRVTKAGIRKLHRSEEAVEQAIEDAGSNEVSKLRRNLRMLYGIAAVAPMLGLLGTVWGMIEAFQVASDPTVDVTNRGPLLGKGIYEALVTTFAGLTVAIPVTIFYYFFLGKIDKLVHEMNEVSVDFLEHYKGERN
jgi:biopolymer transport protein ExbB